MNSPFNKQNELVQDGFSYFKAYVVETNMGFEYRADFVMAVPDGVCDSSIALIDIVEKFRGEESTDMDLIDDFDAEPIVFEDAVVLSRYLSVLYSSEEE